MANRATCLSAAAVAREVLEVLQREERHFQMVVPTLPIGLLVSGGEGLPEMRQGVFVSSSFFDLADAGFTLGRHFDPRQDRLDEGTAVISDGLWKSRFGSDPSVLGRRVGFDGVERTVGSGAKVPGMWQRPGSLERGGDQLGRVGDDSRKFL